MARCERYRQDISACIDGQLSEDAKKQLMAHMKTCPACRALYEDLRAIHEALAPEDAAAPPDLARRAAALARVIPQEQESPKEKKRPAWTRPAALAACCALAALGVWGYSLATQSVGASMSNGAPTAYSEDAGGDEVMKMDVVSGDAAEEAEKDTAAGYTVEPSAAPGSGMEKSASQDSNAEMSEEGAMDGGIAAYGDTRDSEDAVMETAGTQASPCRILSVSGKDAGVWLEERLDVAWTPGDTYELTGQEYDDLCQYLQDTGADFTENDSPEAGKFFVTVYE